MPLREQPAPTTTSDSAPLPEPPVVVMGIGVPASPVSTSLVIDNGVCVNPANVKTTELDVATAKAPDAALVAVTVQVVARDVDRTAAFTLHPAPVTAYVTAPDPEPPAVVSVKVESARVVRLAFEMANAFWAMPVNVNVTGLLAALA